MEVVCATVVSEVMHGMAYTNDDGVYPLRAKKENKE